MRTDELTPCITYQRIQVSKMCFEVVYRHFLSCVILLAIKLAPVRGYCTSLLCDLLLHVVRFFSTRLCKPCVQAVDSVKDNIAYSANSSSSCQQGLRRIAGQLDGLQYQILDIASHVQYSKAFMA